MADFWVVFNINATSLHQTALQGTVLYKTTLHQTIFIILHGYTLHITWDHQVIKLNSV